MFCYFLFDNLRRKTEEREFLYRRDMSELYEQYQASGADEGMRLRMVNRHMNYVASVRESNAEIEADRAKLAALQGMFRACVCVCVLPCVCVAIIRSIRFMCCPCAACACLPQRSARNMMINCLMRPTRRKRPK